MDVYNAEELARAYGQRVYRFAYARLGNRADAEDVTQETFLRLCRAAPDFPDEARARAWLFQVAANCAADLRRAPWRRREVSVEQLPEGQGQTARSPDVGGVLELVLSLPAKYRAAIHLYYYEDESVAQIAQILNISQGAVKSRLHRGRKLLETRLREEETNYA